MALAQCPDHPSPHRNRRVQGEKRVTENGLHVLLKRIAKMMIKEWDPKAKVEEECRVRLGRRHYVVDVVGRGVKGAIAFECNNTESSKLDDLRMLFTKVQHLLPEDALEYLLELLEEATRPVYIDSKRVIRSELSRGPREIAFCLILDDGSRIEIAGKGKNA